MPTFEEDSHSITEPAVRPSSNYNSPPTKDGEPIEGAVGLGGHADVVGLIAEYVEDITYLATSRFHRKNARNISRTQKITKQLLLAVAYGMESEEANITVNEKETGNLFKNDLYAKELLQRSPEFLLQRENVTDWADRTFKNITAFEYALWAQDFKMIEMMLECIPATPDGDEIRTQLLEQYKHVTAPSCAGGGLTYTHIYARPNLDASGIPDGTRTSVREVHTENHFDITPLCNAYQDFYTNHDKYMDRDGNGEFYFIMFIGNLQRLLPVHVLQRYCDRNTPFEPSSQFNSEFKRTTNFSNTHNIPTNDYGALRSSRHGVNDDIISSIYDSFLSSHFALVRVTLRGPCQSIRWLPPSFSKTHLEALLKLKEVSETKIKEITSLLSEQRHAAGPRPS